ncbi:hypothetical protein CDAR_551121 [Caerostris darwini]|uniref:Uncharacterized protein n=1 Tax=Caerostris darwini TaxID=1538125 RepID=A0AAV4VQ83_9ARAC|nr:hypothetical protein CDAR_551121 [Caerostris darwini]
MKPPTACVVQSRANKAQRVLDERTRVLESDISFPPFLLPPSPVVMQTIPRRNSGDKVNGSSHHSIKTLENTPGKRIRPFQWQRRVHRPLRSRTIT